MSFGTGLSGLNASSKFLNVIGHNIANANTIGMKAGRAEFSEMYASSLGAAGGSNGGIGVSVATVAQQFTQGNLKVTGNNLDLAVNGDGFYKVSMTDGSTAYTRNGEFKLDKSGYIVTNAGAKLQGYMAESQGGAIVQGATTDLRLPTGSVIEPNATSEIAITANLNSGAEVQVAEGETLVTTTDDTTQQLTADQKKYGTSLNVYDPSGNAIPVQVYFVKTGANTWETVGQVVSKQADATGNFPVTQFSMGDPITFGSNGKPTTALVDPTTLESNYSIPADAITAGFYATGIPAENSVAIPVNLADKMGAATLTQYGSNFSVYDLTQDGYAAGELTSISVGEDGVITANYSNGEAQGAGQVALTRFRNVQGLQSNNGGYWTQSAASGDPVTGAPQSGRFGAVRSGTLEESNVDLTAELVNMIVAQRSYQANAQTIKTEDQIQQTLINLR